MISKLKVTVALLVSIALLVSGRLFVLELGAGDAVRADFADRLGGTSEVAGGVQASDEDPSYVHSLWLGESFRTYVRQYGPRMFAFVLEESDPNIYGEALDYHESLRFSTSFDVYQVARGVGPYQWLLVGESLNGNQVIEKFEMHVPSGSYAVPPLFLPLGEVATFPIYVGTSGHIAQPARQPLGPIQRTEMYRGLGLGSHPVVAVDPYGRYAYVMSRDLESLFLLPLGGGDPIFSSSGSNSQYLSDVTEARVQMHESEGLKLKCVLTTDGGVDYGYLIFSDYDGDGLWDTNEFMSVQQYQDFGYPGLWTADFISGLGWLLPR